MDDEDFGFCVFWVIAFLAIAGIVAVNGSEKTTNTIADEPKIVEIVKQRESVPQSYSRFSTDHRANVIEEFYTEKKSVDFNKTSVHVFLILASAVSLFIMVSLIRGFFSKLRIGDYLANKMKNDDSRTKHYKKTLDELIQLQERISK